MIREVLFFHIMPVLRKSIVNNLLTIYQRFNSFYNIRRVTTDPNLKRYTSPPPTDGERVWSVKLFSTEDITFTTATERRQAEFIVDRSAPTFLRPGCERQVLDSHGSVSLLNAERVSYGDRPYFRVNVELTRPEAAKESSSVAIVLIPVGEAITREVIQTAFQKSIRKKKKAVIV